MKPVIVGEIPFGRCSLALLISVLIPLSFSIARAEDADDLQSTNRVERPIEELFKTDVVYPEEKGESELELGTLYEKNNPHHETWNVPVSMEYGLTDKWQAEAEWNSYIWRNSHGHTVAHGIGDLELGTQYSFMNVGGSLFHISPLFQVELPLGDVNTDLSEGFVEYEPSVVFARDFPQLHQTQLFTQVGVSFVQRVKRPADADDAEPPANEFNLGAGFFTLWPFGATTFEFNWNDNKWNHHGEENQLYVTPGVLWRVTPGIELGLGVPVGLNQQSDRYQIAAHAVWEF